MLEGAAKNTPGLLPHQLRRAHVHVIAEDLAELGRAVGIRLEAVDDKAPGLVQRHLGQLLQWRLDDELSPTALAIVAVLSVYRGLRGGEKGCGVQAPIEAWAALLGRSVRMVSYAFAQLAERGFVVRHRRLVNVKWVHRWKAHGKEHVRQHERADIYAVAYLSREGYQRIARRGELRRAVLRDGKKKRVLFAAGILGGLLKTLSSNLKVIALRVAGVKERCTPSFGVETREATERKTKEGPVGPPQDGALPDGRERSKRSGAAPPDAGTGVIGLKPWQLELLELFNRGQLEPARAWPAQWKRAHQPFVDKTGHFQEFDRTSRKWLQRCAEEWIAFFSKRELELRLRR